MIEFGGKKVILIWPAIANVGKKGIALKGIIQLETKEGDEYGKSLWMKQ